ncbi:unnamed protein product [Paramecium sonneborni]|uniref:Transmembrane protein n=1 Tax=Paramecium sonneborni TaxID=65129 RepID=A0A8S1RR34_9CILI|nr:unnamed protein product [Paramecium sonneborni]
MNWLKFRNLISCKDRKINGYHYRPQLEIILVIKIQVNMTILSRILLYLQKQLDKGIFILELFLVGLIYLLFVCLESLLFLLWQAFNFGVSCNQCFGENITQRIQGQTSSNGNYVFFKDCSFIKERKFNKCLFKYLILNLRYNQNEFKINKRQYRNKQDEYNMNQEITNQSINNRKINIYICLKCKYFEQITIRDQFSECKNKIFEPAQIDVNRIPRFQLQSQFLSKKIILYKLCVIKIFCLKRQFIIRSFVFKNIKNDITQQHYEIVIKYETDSIILRLEEMISESWELNQILNSLLDYQTQNELEKLIESGSFAFIILLYYQIIIQFYFTVKEKQMELNQQLKHFFKKCQFRKILINGESN